MAGLSNAGKAAMLTGLTGVALYASLHTADPGTTGTSEITGGAPAYARLGITWRAAGVPTAGQVSNSAAMTFNVPPSTSIGWIGYWSAVTAGTYEGGYALSAVEAFTGQGTYTIAIDAIVETQV
jgi:hypothetical protein